MKGDTWENSYGWCDSVLKRYKMLWYSKKVDNFVTFLVIIVYNRSNNA